MPRSTTRSWKKIPLIALLLAILQVSSSYGQQQLTVTGTVTSKDDGLPLPGVAVSIKNTSLGIATDANGKFSISAPKRERAGV